MLFLIDSLLKGLIFWSHAEEALVVDTDASAASLPLTWFSEIPRCSFQCLYPPSLECGCGYLDFTCICRAFEDVAKDENVEACIRSCPHNGDQLYAPGRILDFCNLVGEDIQLPEYMNQYAALHRRAVAVDEAHTIYTTEYFDPTSSAEVPTSTSSTSTTKTSTSTSTTQPYYSAYTYESTGATTARATSAPASASESVNPSSATATGGSQPLIPVSSSSSSGLSTGAKAGIGVAVPLIVIIAGLGLFWWLRKRRGNAAAGSNLPEVSQTEQSWPKKLPLPVATLPAEADGNPLSEVDSNSILPSHSRTTSAQSPEVVYELSGNPSIRRPPAVALDSRRQAELLDRQSQSSETYVTGSNNNISRKAISSSISSPGSELATWMDVDASLQNLETGAVTSSQQLSETSQTRDGGQGSELTQLETEMARIREQRERLQQLHLLEEQEEQLKKRIAALRAGGESV